MDPPKPAIHKRLGALVVSKSKALAQKSRETVARKKQVFNAYIESTALAEYLQPKSPLGRTSKGGDVAAGTGGAGDGAADGATAPDKNTEQESGGLLSLLNLLLFVFLFVALMSLQIRGPESLAMSQANLGDQTRSPVWIDLDPLRSVNYDGIKSMQDVFVWSKSALVSNLYAAPACVSTDGTTVTLLEDGSTSCAEEETTVNRVAGWNSGFQYKTFVRITIQQACYETNPDTKWKDGYPSLRVSDQYTDCTVSSCSLESCQDPTGNDRSRPTFVGSSGTSYTFYDPAELGTFARTGGYQVYLMKNQTTALQRLENLKTDLLFSELEVTSMVFDYVTQNSNTDLYTYNSVAFSQSETGFLLKSASSVPLPFAIFSDGNYYSGERTTILVLSILYFLCVLIYTYQEVNKLRRQHRETFAAYNENPFGVDKPHMWQFLMDHYSKSGFNLLETASTLSSLIILLYFALYLAQAFRTNFMISATRHFRWELPNSEVKSYGISAESSETRLFEEDAYIFLQFETLRDLYGTILIFASINSLFLTLKVVKFVLGWKVFYIIATTLARALSLILVFTVVMTLQLIGFALLFHVEFGAVIPDLGSPVRAVDTMFRFLLGDFERILQEMKQKGDVLASVMFFLFMLFFYFLLIQIYLATMMSTYSHCVSNVTVRQAHALVGVYDADEAARQLRKKRQKEAREHRKKAMSVIEEEGDPQTTLFIARTLNCLKNLFAFFSSDNSDSKNLFDKEQEELNLSSANPEFWMHNGGLAEVDRDVVDVTQKFEHEADIAYACPPQTPGYLSLTPEFSAGPEIAHVTQQLTQLKAMRQKRDQVDGAPPLTFEKQQEFYLRCLKNTLTDVMFTRKGARLFTSDENYASHTFQVEDFADLQEMATFLAGHVVYGEELWLDAVLSQLEEVDAHFVNTLFTKDAKLPTTEKVGQRVLEKLRKPLYEGGELVLTFFEQKARAEYYSQVLEEAHLRKVLCREQNRILHDYATELQTYILNSYQETRKLERKKLYLLEQLRRMV
ncbi:unnamed protein product [Amoebophrya sp. A120]|nr:unnamed protein product [Amoebophrya sp. A120]|eukprot:GSA120T00002350001.1